MLQYNVPISQLQSPSQNKNSYLNLCIIVCSFPNSCCKGHQLLASFITQNASSPQPRWIAKNTTISVDLYPLISVFFTSYQTYLGVLVTCFTFLDQLCPLGWPADMGKCYALHLVAVFVICIFHPADICCFTPIFDCTSVLPQIPAYEDRGGLQKHLVS